MNSTPNYGYETEISAISTIDQNLKRVEAKADKAYEQVIKHEENLKCLAKQKCDGYSKCETDKLLDSKVDKKDGCRLICEDELQDIQKALDDRYTKDKLYTQDEVDTLLDTKADIPALKVYEAELTDGIIKNPNHACSYCKTQEGIVHLNLCVKPENGDLPIGDTILTTLPEGFRPRATIVGNCLSTNGSFQHQNLSFFISTTGKVNLRASSEINMGLVRYIFLNVSFPAK